MRNPFIAGSWVRGENFFGRTSILRDILEGDRNSLWVVGARRLGKTSLLKQLELQVQQNPSTPFAPLYWDPQGSADARGLGDSLLESVEDSEPFRRATDLAPEDLDGLGVADMLVTMVRRTVKSGWRLLLLVDEAEEFLAIARNEPTLLPRLRRVFQRGPELRVVLTSTRRLARVDDAVTYDTSPFLQGFIPPLYLTPLSPPETLALLARGDFPEADARAVMERTGCHPFLVQFIASRLFESRDLVATLDQVAADEMVANFFAVDFQTLEGEERAILEHVAREGPRTRRELALHAGRSEETLLPSLLGLTMMGYLGEAGDRLTLGNWFFERWLRRVEAGRPKDPVGTSGGAA